MLRVAPLDVERELYVGTQDKRNNQPIIKPLS